ncbi:hypothetical protein [Methanofervidicoccus abyssi]|uniref:Uncharacterized protein n=1 Tax=Methanofervidicoccus abyssi TaxID=2082189 RepID=A0A401HNM2_9EURY|nr:hypothetical protein [Methanofervidicoccus abyssi]GBF35838.1 hypothetical protein MHHB_P0063 [Methanofervidicoccus abyssi]
MKKRKYRGVDPFKRILNNPKNIERLYKLYYIITLWVWFVVVLGALIFIVWAIKYLRII